MTLRLASNSVSVQTVLVDVFGPGVTQLLPAGLDKVAGSVERSNVDIASEFTKLIVAQRAYTANTKVVTTADQMLSDTINMAR
jgi:flagellar hook protein FlgE